MTNLEIKEQAWNRLWKGQWFWKLFGGGLLLQLCGQAVQTVLAGILGRLGVDDWQDYMLAVKLNRVNPGEPIPQFTREYVTQATLATGLELFLGWILAAIAAYGVAVLLVKCLKDEPEGWLGAAFGGFRMPWGLLGLFFRYALIFVGWMLPAILAFGIISGVAIPACSAALKASSPVLASLVVTFFVSLALLVFAGVFCVPFYRYRFVWLVKAEHPDWSAGECLRATKQLMEGHKMRSFRLDCAYWKPIVGVMLLGVTALGGFGAAAALSWSSVGATVLAGLLAAVLFMLAICSAVVLGQYIAVGQAFLYRELSAPQE